MIHPSNLKLKGKIPPLSPWQGPFVISSASPVHNILSWSPPYQGHFDLSKHSCATDQSSLCISMPYFSLPQPLAIKCLPGGQSSFGFGSFAITTFLFGLIFPFNVSILKSYPESSQPSRN